MENGNSQERVKIKKKSFGGPDVACPCRSIFPLFPGELEKYLFQLSIIFGYLSLLLYRGHVSLSNLRHGFYRSRAISSRHPCGKFGPRTCIKNRV